MAKPGIPVKEPVRRIVPDIFDPMPNRQPIPDPIILPAPASPVRTPAEPVPARR